MTDAITLESTKTVGELLLGAREAKRWSRSVLAKKVKMHPNRLQQLELGYIQRNQHAERVPTRVSRDKLLDLCNELEIPLDTTNEILQRSGYEPVSEGGIVYLHRMSERDRKKVRDMVARLREGTR